MITPAFDASTNNETVYFLSISNALSFTINHNESNLRIGGSIGLPLLFGGNQSPLP